jgi:hypothetical protein
MRIIILFHSRFLSSSILHCSAVAPHCPALLLLFFPAWLDAGAGAGAGAADDLPLRVYENTFWYNMQ